MLFNFACAGALVLGTTLIHAACTALVIAWLRSIERRSWALRTAVTRSIVIAALILLMSLAGYLEAGLWALFYWGVGALSSFHDAIYFSLVTLTTLGYGDITLDERWRVVAAFEAANGIILFGWTTAIIVAAAHRIFFQHGAADQGR